MPEVLATSVRILLMFSIVEVAFRALWQTANRANARLKATLGGFHGPLTFFIENPSFFHNSFDLYPIGEKTEVADSEKRTPEAKFRPFFSSILVFPEFMIFPHF